MRLFQHLLHLAQVVCVAIGRLYADAAYDSADNRRLCLDQGIQPDIRQIGEAHGSGLGRIRCVVEHDCAWLLANKRLDRRQDRLGRVILALLTAACIFLVANPSVRFDTVPKPRKVLGRDRRHLHPFGVFGRHGPAVTHLCRSLLAWAAGQHYPPY